MINRLLLKLYRLHIAKSLVLLLLAINLVPLLLELLNLIVPILSSEPPIQNLALVIILICILMPIVETYIFQYLVYELLEKRLKHRIVCLSLISGVLFGSLHYNSISYIIAACCAGFCFQLWYILLVRRYSYTAAYLSIAGIHALHNTITTIIAFRTGAFDA